MREILFRGKQLIYGDWIEGYLIVKDERTYIVQNSAPISRFYYPEKRLICGFYEVKPSTVGQYTGLVDKNGKRIFEGDIVEGFFNHEKIRGYIFYGSDATFFVNRKDMYGVGLNNASDWVEVIGNIHDNPELLKEG